MNTRIPVAAVRQSVTVDAPIERAFKLFTEQFGSFKPREHNLLGVPIAETVFEPRVGGHIYDRGVDGSECHWARVLAYEPPQRVLLSWDISPQWQIERIPQRPASGRYVSLLRAQAEPGLSLNIAIWIVMDRAGKASATASPAIGAGHCT